MALLAALVIFTVIARYCFSLSWKQLAEFNTTLFAFTTFWGMGINVIKDEHVMIDILYDGVKPARKRWLAIINYLIVLAVVLLMLYLWIFFRAIEIFRRCGTAFPGLLVLGLALLITCQALLHIMVTVNLIPETGQTLPLISRGGSSTIFTAIALGMILSVSRQNDEQSHDMPKSESIYEK